MSGRSPLPADDHGVSPRSSWSSSGHDAGSPLRSGYWLTGTSRVADKVVLDQAWCNERENRS